MTFLKKSIPAWLLCLGAAGVSAHVTLEQPQAMAGSTYKAVFKIGHACPGAQATTGIAVRLPAGFRGAKPMPKAGWTLGLRRAATESGPADATARDDVVEVRWTADSAASALPGVFYDEFVLSGRLPVTAGPLWFKVLQSCDTGAADWAEVPVTGTDTRDLKAPAALLELMPAGTHAHHH